MDKITTYKNIVKELILYINSIAPSDEKVETQLIIDDQRCHYLLFSVGWENNNYREYTPFVHIDIKPTGKVWIQHDGTDLQIAILLFEKGIPKSDIVLGYRSPYRRPEIAEFALE